MRIRERGVAYRLLSDMRKKELTLRAHRQAMKPLVLSGAGDSLVDLPLPGRRIEYRDTPSVAVVA